MLLKKSQSSIHAFLNEHLPFLAIAFLTVLFAYPHQEGISPFDPGSYCRCAVDFLRRELQLDNIYCNRVGAWLPIALSIKIFGFSGYYLSWVTVVELLFLVSLVYFFLWRYNKRIAIAACALIGFSPTMLYYSGGLFGDIMTTLTANASILWVWRARFDSNGKYPVLTGFVLAIIWYYALLTKESAFYFLLPLLIFFLIDRREKSNIRFWRAALISGFAMGVIFLLVYVLKTDDFLHRLKVLEGGPNSPRSYMMDTGLLLARVTILPVNFLIGNFGYFVLLLPALLQLFSRSENESEKFFKIYLVSLLMLWWCGTQSFTQWKPVVLLDRLWLPLMVPLAVNAAHVFGFVSTGHVKRYETRSTIGILLIFVILIPVGGYFRYVNEMEEVHPAEFIIARISFVLVLFAVIFYKGESPYLIGPLRKFISGIKFMVGLVKKHVVLGILFLALLLHNSKALFQKDPHDNNYLSEKEMIDFIIENRKPSVVICEQSVYLNRGIYYGFDTTVEKMLQFIGWNEIDSMQMKELIQGNDVYLMFTKDRIRWYSSAPSLENAAYIHTRDSIPAFVSKLDLHWELIKKNSRTLLYRYNSTKH